MTFQILTVVIGKLAVQEPKLMSKIQHLTCLLLPAQRLPSYPLALVLLWLLLINRRVQPRFFCREVMVEEGNEVSRKVESLENVPSSTSCTGKKKDSLYIKFDYTIFFSLFFFFLLLYKYDINYNENSP